MKKVAFMFVAAMAIAFASCGGAQTKGAEECCDSTECCGDSTVAPVAEEVVAEAPAAEEAPKAE